MEKFTALQEGLERKKKKKSTQPKPIRNIMAHNQSSRDSEDSIVLTLGSKASIIHTPVQGCGTTSDTFITLPWKQAHVTAATTMIFFSHTLLPHDTTSSQAPLIGLSCSYSLCIGKVYNWLFQVL